MSNTEQIAHWRAKLNQKLCTNFEIEILFMLEQQQTQIDELTNHATSLVEFAKGCIETVFKGGSYDGGDMQDQLVRVGVLTQVEYNPEIHGYCKYGSEKGDPYFVMSDWFKQLKNGGEHE